MGGPTSQVAAGGGPTSQGATNQEPTSQGATNQTNSQEADCQVWGGVVTEMCTHRHHAIQTKQAFLVLVN